MSDRWQRLGGLLQCAKEAFLCTAHCAVLSGLQLWPSHHSGGGLRVKATKGLELEALTGGLSSGSPGLGGIRLGSLEKQRQVAQTEVAKRYTVRSKATSAWAHGQR